MALVQEMNVKIDKGLIISLASLFSQQKELLEEVLCHGSTHNKLMSYERDDDVSTPVPECFTYPFVLFIVVIVYLSSVVIFFRATFLP